MSERRDRRWFLPETPDVIGLLRRQTAVTLEALEALSRWAGGDAAAAQTVRDAEPRGDAAKRDLMNALREAFILQWSRRMYSPSPAGSTGSSTAGAT